METLNTYYENPVGLKNFVAENREVLLHPNNRSVLVQIFAGICDMNHVGTISEQIRQLIPGAQVIGTTTNGEVMNGTVSGLKTVLSFSVFQSCSCMAGIAEPGDRDDYQLGQLIAARLYSKSAKVLILFATGQTVNGSQLLKGVESVNSDLPVAGGNSGDNLTNDHGFVFCNDEFTGRGVVGAVIEGECLNVSCHYHLGWQPIGKEMTITRAAGARVYTIDNIPAFQIYRLYLGIAEHADIYNVVEYPLAICKHGIEISRSPFMRHKDDSLSFFSDMEEGDKVRFSFGHVETILKDIDTLLANIRQEPVESIYVYSCASRRAFLQESTQIETLPLQGIAPTAGFFTSGEYFHTDSSNQLLNTTMTILALSESKLNDSICRPIPLNQNAFQTRDGNEPIIKDNVTNRNIDILFSLTHLINQVTGELNQRTAELEEANQIIKQREDRLRLVLDGSTEGFWDWNLETGEVYRSERWVSILGQPINEPHLDFWADVVHPDDIKFTMKVLNDYLEGQIPKYETEYRLLDEFGETKWIFERGSIIEKDKHGKPLRIAGTCTDITERKIAEALLRISEDKFSKAFRCNPDPITITTLEDGLYVEMNDAWEKQTGYKRHEAIGRTGLELGIWCHQKDRDKMGRKLKKAGYLRNYETSFRMRSGEKRIFSISAEIFDMDNKPHLICMHSDITERKLAEEKIRYLSYHDKLTGLYNRTFFEEELERISNSGDFPYGLIIGDVNGLKLINDALGHQEGDKVLIKAADLLTKAGRKQDIISRWGGDEFIILMPGCDRALALNMVESINDSFMNTHDMPIQMNISLGMAIYTSPEQNIRDIIRDAEEKMYRNKLLESRSTRSSFIRSLEKTLWERSHETEEHCKRMQSIAEKLGGVMKLSDSELDNLKLLAALHDIGKIAIPDTILNKPEKLSREEWETVKSHPEIGYRIALSSPELAPIAEAILHHHEWWDGSGYPLGLTGESIPLISRIIAITDAYDVMLNGRPYKQAISREEALQEIQRCAGTQFDPYLVNKLLYSMQ